MYNWQFYKECVLIEFFTVDSANSLNFNHHHPKHTSSPTYSHIFIVVLDVHVTVHRDRFLIIKPTRCANFSNLFLEWNSTCFRQFLCPSSGTFYCTHNSGICHKGLRLLASRIRVEPSSYSPDGSKPVWHTPLLCVQWKTPDDGHRNCPKHVEFHSKNKFE